MGPNRTDGAQSGTERTVHRAERSLTKEFAEAILHLVIVLRKHEKPQYRGLLRGPFVIFQRNEKVVSFKIERLFRNKIIGRRNNGRI